MGFFNYLVKSYVDNSFVSDAKKTLAICQAYGPKERVMLKVCTTTALAKLVHASEDMHDDTFRMLSEAMYSCRQLSNEEVALASKFNLQLMEMQKHFHASKAQSDRLVAAGLPVWITSIRALSNVSVLPYAREIWSTLQESDLIDYLNQLDFVASRVSNSVYPVLMRVRMLDTPTLFAQS